MATTDSRPSSDTATSRMRNLREMLEVAARHGVKARTERFPLAQVNEALGRVARNEVRYRAVLTNG